MQTETGAGEAKAGGKKQRVQDEFGGIYELKSKLAEGGQGIVLSTDFQNLLVKVSRWPDGDPRTQAWRKQVEALQRMPVVDEGLPVVMPKARIVKPRAGYVMELVDGLIPLELLLKESIESFASGMGLQGFVSSGGLARRLRVLARLARVLAQLHGLGLAHGDISPKNVFVSTSHDQGEVWLIDCDNLTYAVRDSSLQVYTPDYGAPEILRGDAGINTYTDVWSFAVIAFQLLVQLHPFKGGELVDQDSDLEVAALRGELPWIDHRDDARNRSAMGIDREYVLTPLLVELFDRCFRLGVVDPELRPTMGEWAEAFEAATAVQVLCLDSIGCGSTFYWNKAIQCPFCDTRHDPSSVLRLSHAVYAPPAELGEDAAPAHSWINEEVLVREAGGELLLRQDSRTLRLRLTPLSGPLEGYAQDQTSIWVLARVKPNLISLRCARPSQSNSLERPLEIGVDQRVADDLHQQRKTSAPTVAAAMQWLTDEFVCERQGFGGNLVFAAILPRAKSGQAQRAVPEMAAFVDLCDSEARHVR